MSNRSINRFHSDIINKKKAKEEISRIIKGKNTHFWYEFFLRLHLFVEAVPFFKFNISIWALAFGIIQGAVRSLNISLVMVSRTFVECSTSYKHHSWPIVGAVFFILFTSLSPLCSINVIQIGPFILLGQTDRIYLLEFNGKCILLQLPVRRCCFGHCIHLFLFHLAQCVNAAQIHSHFW